MTMPGKQPGHGGNATGGDAIKVMLVDDSAVIRGLLARTLEADKDIRVVSSVHNGQVAVSSARKAAPDVIVLDIEMPVMDGITALPLLLKEVPGARVLICSTLSRQGAAISLKALELGATECLVKPTSTSDISGSQEFQATLLRLVKTLGRARAAHAGVPKTAERVQTPAKPLQTFTLRDRKLAYAGKPSIIAIGSSTGGPQALFETLRTIAGIDIPVVITQHMPKTFTAILAEHIQVNCGIPCCEGANGMTVERGRAYVAPGGYHMEIIRNAGRIEIRLLETPPENFCKPSVEPMMRSVVDIYGNKALGIMLTGMGSDGLDGFRKLAEKGGRIIAQDEKTSVVWGMPGAVALAGLCTEVMPVHEIGPWLRKNVIEM